MEENKTPDTYIKKDKTNLWIILNCIASVIAMILTPILMYAIYALQYPSDPNVSELSGYWVGFILALIPLSGIIYSFIIRLKTHKFKYIILLTVSLISFLVILLISVASLSSLSQL